MLLSSEYIDLQMIYDGYVGDIYICGITLCVANEYLSSPEPETPP